MNDIKNLIVEKGEDKVEVVLINEDEPPGINHSNIFDSISDKCRIMVFSWSKATLRAATGNKEEYDDSFLGRSRTIFGNRRGYVGSVYPR